MIRFLIMGLVVGALQANVYAEEKSIVGPVLLGTGIALISSGFVGTMSAAAWTPLIEDQEEWIDELRRGGYDTSDATAALSDMKSSRSNIKTVAMVSLSAGIISAVVGMVKIENAKRVKVLPQVTKQQASINIGYSF